MLALLRLSNIVLNKALSICSSVEIVNSMKVFIVSKNQEYNCTPCFQQVFTKKSDALNWCYKAIGDSYKQSAFEEKYIIVPIFLYAYRNTEENITWYESLLYTQNAASEHDKFKLQGLNGYALVEETFFEEGDTLESHLTGTSYMLIESELV